MSDQGQQFTTEQLLLAAQSHETHINVAQRVLVVTEDKLRLCLTNKLKAAASKDAWHTPVGMFLAILTTLLTSKFEDAMRIPAATWQSVFLVGCALTLVWSAKTIYAAMLAPGNDALIELIVSELKQQSVVRVSKNASESESSADAAA